MTLPKAAALALLLFHAPSRAPALLMGDAEGPEPIFVQIKQSLRLSLDLDAQLQGLASVEANLGLSVTRRFVGPTYLELVAFPNDFTEAQALSAIALLQQLPAVEMVVPVSSSNLIWRSGDFGKQYGPGESIPEAVRRGLDSGPILPVDPSVVLSPHAPNRLIVSWKPEFLWNAAQTGFLEKIAMFNAFAHCRVISETSHSPTDLAQVLEWTGSDNLLLAKLQLYTASGWIRYAQPDFLYFADSLNPLPTPRRVIGLKARRLRETSVRRQIE